MVVNYAGNGIHIIQGEISVLVMSIKKFHWSSKLYQENESNPLLKNLIRLRHILNQRSDLSTIEPNTILAPFLDVILFAEIPARVTILALTAVNKFILYDLVGGVDHNYLPSVADNVADVVVHAAHSNTDTKVLTNVVEVLRTLISSPLGPYLSNDNICEILSSCFKICFETRFNDLLRENAKHCLRNIVHFLFTRLPSFIETTTDTNLSYSKKMRMQSNDSDENLLNDYESIPRVNSQSTSVASDTKWSKGPPSPDEYDPNDFVMAEIPAEAVSSIIVENESHPIPEVTSLPENEQKETNLNLVDGKEHDSEGNTQTEDVEIQVISAPCDQEKVSELEADKKECLPSVPHSNPVSLSDKREPLVQSQDVQPEVDDQDSKDQLITKRITLKPHDTTCVQELLRFLASICNPYDKPNTDDKRLISLSLLTVAFEVSGDVVSRHTGLLTIVQDSLCRNLLWLMNFEETPLQIFTAIEHVSFLLFESMRNHLKFQMENFLSRLNEIILSDNPKISPDKKEIALGTLLRLWRIPGFDTELYLNYDCGPYCSNLYEEITDVLAKSVNPTEGFQNTHLLAMESFFITIDSIEKRCSRLPTDKGTAESNIDIEELKRRKELLNIGTRHFNANPKKGIQFLQEKGLLSADSGDVARFLRENPNLDKKMIGDYVSSKGNVEVLENFVKLFDFRNLRIDQAWRIYVQSFRLPGESQLIERIANFFADRWHECNNEMYSKEAISSLTLATAALNTFLHNETALKHCKPMSLEMFKKSVKDLKCGEEFEDEAVESIFQSIKEEKIIMPAEHVGVVRENYLWEVLLRRSASKDGVYVSSNGGECDHELFKMCWKSIVVALTLVFDKATDLSVCSEAVEGFRKCAKISAHFGMSDAVDFLMSSLCKFTMLTSPSENVESFTISFGMNVKARLAAETVFNLVHDGHEDILHKEWRPSDVLRKGWRYVFDCIFQLFRCKLLPKILTEAEDFLELSGKISLIREDVAGQKSTETGLLNSLYSYVTSLRDSRRILTDEEKNFIETAKTCILDCHLEDLIPESKDLRTESFHELLKVLIRACYNAENLIVVDTKQDEDKAVFFLELMLRVVVQNRDRISSVWWTICDHLHALLLAAISAERRFLTERCVIGLLRLAIRLTSRDEISSSVLQSLHILLQLKRSILYSVSRQISYGLYELMKTSAANIHTEPDWAIVFTLFEVVGAGAPLPKFGGSNDNDNCTDGGTVGNVSPRLSGSDSNLNQRSLSNPSLVNSSLFLNEDNVENEETAKPFYTCHDLLPHDPFSLVRCCECLAFLIRDGTYITSNNFSNCVHTIRTFVEATLYAGVRKRIRSESSSHLSKSRHRKSPSLDGKYSSGTMLDSAYESEESEVEEYPDVDLQVSLQLLDLMDTLHAKTSQIHVAKDGTQDLLWPCGWRPLLQGIARLCCDARKPVRMSAITYLQKTLLAQDLQMLKANEWESCFSHVLFPLLEQLAGPLETNYYVGIEETRMRAAMLLSKVFLHHLSALQLLPSFTDLWLKILDFMNRFMSLDENSDLLSEAIQESVKNMILVMENSKLFSDYEIRAQFWAVTWEKVNKLAPNLKNELSRSYLAVREIGDYRHFANTPRSPNNERSIPEPAKMVSENAVKMDAPETPFTQYSVPIFPHMGQLMSTSIGPMPVRNQVPSQNEETVAKNDAFQWQMSSLMVASTPEFLASLPSFRPQPLPNSYRPEESISMPYERIPLVANRPFEGIPLASCPTAGFDPTNSAVLTGNQFESNTIPSFVPSSSPTCEMLDNGPPPMPERTRAETVITLS